MIYPVEEGLGGGEEEGDDDPDRPEEPEVENDPAPPPDYDNPENDNEDDDTIILDEGEEGPEEEGAGGGDVDPVGATGTTPASVSSEVRAAIDQAFLVSEGLAPPAKTINITPLPDFQSPAPQVVPPTADLQAHRALSQQERGLIKKAVAKALKPQGHSSRSKGPAPSSSGAPRTPALAQPRPPPPQQPAPQPQGPAIPLSTGGSWLPPALPAGCTVGFAAPGVALSKPKRLSDTPLANRGYKWHQQSWEAYCLLRGEGEWVTPGVRYLSERSPRRQAAKPSLRWTCTLCPHLVSSKADGRGHYQSSHLGGLRSSPLCTCPSARRGFNLCTVLAKHLDFQHNADPTMVQQVPPFMYLKYIDRPALAPSTGTPLKSNTNSNSPGPSHLFIKCTYFCK